MGSRQRQRVRSKINSRLFFIINTYPHGPLASGRPAVEFVDFLSKQSARRNQPRLFGLRQTQRFHRLYIGYAERWYWHDLFYRIFHSGISVNLILWQFRKKADSVRGCNPCLFWSHCQFSQCVSGRLQRPAYRLRSDLRYFIHGSRPPVTSY